MPKERNKADGYREKAYEGDTKAMNNLGVCYERGTGVKVNLEMAFEWYMKAAEQGDVYGCFNVGEWIIKASCGADSSIKTPKRGIRPSTITSAREHGYHKLVLT